jgi:hypothetical protein
MKELVPATQSDGPLKQVLGNQKTKQTLGVGQSF